MTCPFSIPQAWDATAEGYLSVVEPFAAHYCHDALSWARLADTDVVLDVACGPGTLALPAARAARSVVALDFSAPMIRLLDSRLESGGVDNVSACVGDGQSLPYADGAFDAAFSMFGLMFFPDKTRGFGELARVLRPGGRLAITTWAPLERSMFMTVIFEAIEAAGAGEAQGQDDDTEAFEMLTSPEEVATAMHAAGFVNVDVRPSTHAWRVESADDLWNEMVRGSAPIVMQKAALSESDWTTFDTKAREYLRERLGDLPTDLGSEALLATGVVPAR